MNIPSSMKLEKLLYPAGDDITIEWLVDGIRSRNPSVKGIVPTVLKRAEEFYNISEQTRSAKLKLGFIYLAIANYAKAIDGRKRALPLYFDAFEKFQLVLGSSHYIPASILLQYPELMDYPGVNLKRRISVPVSSEDYVVI